ncbi:PQQ-binding-like beta-propeller repeat protein [Soonwooa sp.]|uniref:outer membrane protein assembly factor BamB family protein n=1 Tax=Soonwooa sp. TaxID=1938592 RepID=UPI0026369743|nr:PQQ-binding-like beta-propeller repeat protein [Soonwooa sp.]
MKIIWTIDIDDENYFEPNHNAMPVIWKEKLFYAFETVDKTNIDENGLYRTKIVVLEINPNCGDVSKKEYSFSQNQTKGKIVRPSDWKFITGISQLQLNAGILFNISQSQIQSIEEQLELETFSIKSEYNFGNRVLKYNQRSKLECFDSVTHKLVWTTKLKGYLYTEIEQKDKLIFFGTAGNGGAFYCIDIENGDVLTEYNNGDASNYAWSNNNIIIRDKKGNLTEINSRNGKEIQLLKLIDKISFYAPILVNENKVFIRTFNKQENKPKLICVEI